MSASKWVPVLAIVLVALPVTVSSQLTPDVMPVWIFEILESSGARLGTVTVVGESERGFETGNEYWSFREKALREIAEQPSLEFAVLAAGDWDDPWVIEALGWSPEGRVVAWRHPTEVEWVSQDDTRPPLVEGSTYFGDETLGGLSIQYSERGAASLTWFKTTDGAFMQLQEGARFARGEAVPTTGSWWHGPIEGP